MHLTHYGSTTPKTISVYVFSRQSQRCYFSCTDGQYHYDLEINSVVENLKTDSYIKIVVQDDFRERFGAPGINLYKHSVTPLEIIEKHDGEQVRQAEAVLRQAEREIDFNLYDTPSIKQASSYKIFDHLTDRIDYILEVNEKNKTKFLNRLEHARNSIFS